MNPERQAFIIPVGSNLTILSGSFELPFFIPYIIDFLVGQ